MMVDGEPQVWLRKQNDDERRNATLHRVSESIRQAVKRKCTTNVKDKLTHPKRRLGLGNEELDMREYHNHNISFN